MADSPLPPIPPPIFSQNYSRPPFTSIASNFYSQFGGFARPDNKPTSTSAASFVAGKNAADGPPGPQDRPSRDSSQYSNFPPHRGERERDDPYESGSDRLELDGDPAGPPPPKRSPPRSHRLPSSSDHEQRSPRHIQSDSTTDPTSPSHRRPYEDEDNRSAGRPPVLVKTENTLDGRRRSFTGELQGSREDLRTISAGSSGNPRAEGKQPTNTPKLQSCRIGCIHINSTT